MSSRAETLLESQQTAQISAPDPNKRDLKFWIIAWIPALIAVSVIAVESTAMLGAEHTSHWLRPFWTRFFGAVDNEMWESIHWRIRKGGHFIGYGMVSLLFFRSWYTTLRVKIVESRTGYWWRAAGLSMLATIIIASSDELHQFFIPNRTGRLEDVIIDTCGGILAQLILAAVYFSRRDRIA